jgi:hypothetical protein
VEIAGLPSMDRGYEGVKLKSIAVYQKEMAKRLAEGSA